MARRAPHIATLCLLALLWSCSSDDNHQPGGNDTSAPVQDTLAGGDLPGTDAPTPDVTPGGDSEAVTPNSYRLTLQLETGPGITCDADAQLDCFDGKTCCEYVFERDLTGLETKFAFGSTHIAPAVSFAMTDTIYNPTFAVITLNFGIIIGTSDKPPATPMSGEYAFGGFEPEVTVDIFNKAYSSKQEGATGAFDITDWAAEEGGTWAGTVSGTIVQDTPNDVKLRARVEGRYDFVLPEPAG